MGIKTAAAPKSQKKLPTAAKQKKTPAAESEFVKNIGAL